VVCGVGAIFFSAGSGLGKWFQRGFGLVDSFQGSALSTVGNLSAV
jgi:hypothetical protein